MLVLAGWVMGWTTLESLADGWPTMKVNTAVCFLLAGVAVLLLAWPQPGPVRAGAALMLAGALVLIPVLTLSQDLLGWGHNVDRMFGSWMRLSDAGGFERMSQASALGFLLAGVSILMLHGNMRSVGVAQTLAATVCLLAMLSLLAYLFDAQRAVAQPFSSMALHTACAFVVLSAGLLSIRCHTGWVREFFRDTPTAALGRRYLAGTVLVLPLMAQLSILGERNLGW
jgi:hypothetical protein